MSAIFSIFLFLMFQLSLITISFLLSFYCGISVVCCQPFLLLLLLSQNFCAMGRKVACIDPICAGSSSISLAYARILFCSSLSLYLDSYVSLKWFREYGNTRTEKLCLIMFFFTCTREVVHGLSTSLNERWWQLPLWKTNEMA